MSFFDDNFVIEEGPFPESTKQGVEIPKKEQIEKDKAEVKRLDEETLIMNKNSVKMQIKEFREAYHKKDSKKYNSLVENFKKILKCLGNESKELLEINKIAIKSNIVKEGASALNVAKLKNCEAKLGIIEYKQIIKEAAESHMRENENNNVKTAQTNVNKSDNNTKKKVVACGAVAAALVVAMGAGVKKCSDKNAFVRQSDSTTITETNGTTTFMEETTTNTTTTSTTDYTLETVGNGYTAETRETTGETSETKKDDKKSTTKTTTKKTPAATKPGTKIKRLRKRTKNGKVIVLKKATPIPTQKPVKPGSNTLPKPTHVTVNKNADSVNKAEKKLSLRLEQ